MIANITMSKYREIRKKRAITIFWKSRPTPPRSFSYPVKKNVKAKYSCMTIIF